MKKRLIQYYEDDVYGFVRYIDTKQNHHGVKAQPKHIRLDSGIAARDKAMIRRAIADDINGESK